MTSNIQKYIFRTYFERILNRKLKIYSRSKQNIKSLRQYCKDRALNCHLKPFKLSFSKCILVWYQEQLLVYINLNLFTFLNIFFFFFG